MKTSLAGPPVKDQRKARRHDRNSAGEEVGWVVTALVAVLLFGCLILAIHSHLA